MTSLKNGVLVKLLDDMKMADDDVENDKKPVLLQIRSIVPQLEEGTLWPNRGFFIKVSDLSHAMDVSLPEEQNDMIFGNKLKLGQFIYVQKLEKSHPVPLLIGVTPVPGRHSCEGTPEDILLSEDLGNLHDHSNADLIVEKGVILEKKIVKKIPKNPSDSESSRKRNNGLGTESRERPRSSSTSKARRSVIRTEKCSMRMPDFEKPCKDIFVEWPKSRASSVDNDSDTESVVSSTSSTFMSKRRSWNESEILGVKGIFDSSVVKHDIRPSFRSRSANVSPARSARYDSSDDNSSLKPRRRDASTTKRIVKSVNRSQTPVTKVKQEQVSNSLCGLIYDRKGAETGISWNSLPSNLVKFGKEVVRQRDIALLAAADALQEACAAERLLNSLSTLSEFPLVEGDDLQPCVDKFFDLQEDLSRTRLIMQSLTSISPLRGQETETCNTNSNSIKETLNIALERKKNAKSWIKTAVAHDLSPCPQSLAPLTNFLPVTMKKKSSISTRNTKPKGSFIVKSNADIKSCDKEDQPEWTKGSTLCSLGNLAASLNDECRKLFLSYVEKYLDDVEKKSEIMESDEKMAGMMYKVKKVSDWLDNVIVNKDQEVCTTDDSGMEAYGRVRNKIYGILLKNVERTAMAFNI